MTYGTYDNLHVTLKYSHCFAVVTYLPFTIIPHHLFGGANTGGLAELWNNNGTIMRELRQLWDKEENHQTITGHLGE